MVEILPCHSSAKRHRLDCLYLLIVHVLKSEAFKDEFFYLLKSKVSKVGILHPYLSHIIVYHKKSELVYCRQDESMAMAWPEVFVTEIILALKEVMQC